MAGNRVQTVKSAGHTQIRSPLKMDERDAAWSARSEDQRSRRRGVVPKVGELCRAAFERERESAVRPIQGVLVLARKYGAAATEDACAAALDIGVCDYRFVRRYLKRQRPEPAVLKQIDPLIRELTRYRDYVNVVTAQRDQP